MARFDLDTFGRDVARAQARMAAGELYHYRDLVARGATVREGVFYVGGPLCREARLGTECAVVLVTDLCVEG